MLVKTRLGDTIFPLNGVFWSLFFELLANVAYALGIRLLKGRILNAIIVVGLGGLVLLVATGFSRDGGLTAGGEINTWAGGVFRVAFSYFLGVKLYRVWSVGHLRAWSANPLLLGAALLLLLSPPSGTWAAMTEIGFVAIVFPAFLILGANHASDKRLAKLSALLGALSYPLYVLQTPLLWLFTGAVKYAHLKLAFPLAGGIAMGIVCLTSWVILKLYDEPLRDFLSRFLQQPRLQTPR
jgi:peptidoglycan/LPS O-acetylase OafA/YrhL